MDNQLFIEDETGAIFVADSLISLVSSHARNIQTLAEFWSLNKKPLDLLKSQFNQQFLRVKDVFTQERVKLQQQGLQT